MSKLNRREFLKNTSYGLLGGLLGYGDLNLLSPVVQGSKIYQGTDLNGWTVLVGDGIKGDVTLSDIKTSNFTEYSEVIGNVFSRPEIMAHNLSFFKTTQNEIFNYIHICEYKFRLPYLPDVSNTEYNGQTVEGGITLWNGTTRMLYLVGFQWLINPFWIPGVMQCWTPRLWQPIGSIALDTQWHSVRIAIDCLHETTCLTIDNEYYPSCFTKKTGPSDWGNEIAAWISAEAISIDPGNELTGGKIHKVQFKDWTWLWLPFNMNISYLPFIQK